MQATMLREVLQAILPTELIESEAWRLKVIRRKRTICITSLLIALVLNGGSEEDRGRLSEIHREYQSLEDALPVGRSGFNARFTEPLSMLVATILSRALEYVRELPVLLGGPLANVPKGLVDWLAIDSEAVSLRTMHSHAYSNGRGGAGFKLHKVLSLGRLTTVDFRLSPSREHDNKHFRVTEAMANHGLLVDLAYASMNLLSDCATHHVSYVIRLKSSWKPMVNGRLFEDYYDEIDDPMPFQLMIEKGEVVLDGSHHDLDVLCGKDRIPSRLVGVPTPESEYRFYLTNLPRVSHTPQDTCDIYRCRWEVESDNKVDKSGSRLDHLRHARSLHTVHTLVFSSILHSVIAGVLAHRHHQNILSNPDERKKRPPLHKIQLALVIASLSRDIHRAIRFPDQTRWDHLAHKIEIQAHDTNWRSRPSVMDLMTGLHAPPGRPRNATLSESPLSAVAFRFREKLWRSMGLA